MANGRKLPEGCRDLLPDTLSRRRGIETRVSGLFEDRGYREVSPPLIELWEQMDIGALSAYACYQTTDRLGRTLVLRPEFTTSIARIAAARMAGEVPLRLCALGPVFMPGGGTRRPRETVQADAELIGVGGGDADAELIALAAESLRACGLTSFTLELGHAGFLRAFLTEAGLDAAQTGSVIACMEARDALALELLLAALPLSGESRRRLAALPECFGGRETLDAAAGWCRGRESRAALESLRAVYGILEARGLGGTLSIDLSMAHVLDYYTGVIFRGITRRLGAPLLSGGRYDGMMEKLGTPMPAAGFAVNITALDDALCAGQEADGGDILTFALAKGRLGDRALGLFRSAGLDIPEIDESSRRLVYTNARGDRFLLVKPGDVPAYVDGGAADIGVVGKDTLLEENRPLYELLDLGYGACRLCVAGYPDQAARTHHRVATKYPGVAHRYYGGKGETIEIVKLSGSIELAPVVGLSDVILDIVESGSTLRANGLAVLEEIAPCSARLVANRVSYKTKAARVRPLVEALRGICKRQGE